MRQIFLSILLCASTAAVIRASQTVPLAEPRPAPIGPDAVWNPPASFHDAFRAACGKLEGPKFSECFVEQMAKAGAPKAAVAFARRVDGMGFARTFHDTGAVDIVWAEYPFRANENRVCLLVNGDPAIVDVDDLSRFDRSILNAYPIWQKIVRWRPKVDIFPSDRVDTSLPIVQRMPGNETWFMVGYELKECHACATIGTLRLLWKFDASGKFLGIGVRQVRRGRI